MCARYALPLRVDGIKCGAFIAEGQGQVSDPQSGRILEKSGKEVPGQVPP